MGEIDTIVAPATPQGESAIAIVRASGSLVSEMALALRKGRPPPPRRVWRCDYQDLEGRVLDEVICCMFKGPASYTGEDVLEISSHGNPLIVNLILKDMCARGCRLAAPGEFTKRAFLRGKMDLTRAEAVIDVINARSERALAAAQRQLRGDLGRRVGRLVDRLLDCCAAIEAYIDFPDEDLPVEDRRARMTDLSAITGELEAMEVRGRNRELLKHGPRVVIIGEPNSGKSTLLNRLAGYERAIVGREPGTTRDFLEEVIKIGPHHIRVVDTAGLREAAGEIEKAGVERALQQASDADVFLLVVDATRPCPALPVEVRLRLNASNCVVVVNKIDLPARGFEGVPELYAGTVEVSALDGAGFDQLGAVMIDLLDRVMDVGERDEGLSVSVRHSEALRASRQGIARAVDLLVSSAALELVGSELRGAIFELQKIAGPIDQEEVLDRLFAMFCIGK